MKEITFIIEPCAETGGFVARWDAPGGGGLRLREIPLPNWMA